MLLTELTYNSTRRDVSLYACVGARGAFHKGTRRHIHVKNAMVLRRVRFIAGRSELIREGKWHRELICGWQGGENGQDDEEGNLRVSHCA